MKAKELIQYLNTVREDAEVLIQLPDDSGPVDIVPDYYPDNEYSTVVLFPVPPEDEALWDIHSNVITWTGSVK